MSVPGRPAVERFTNGQSIGIGSLPHLNADAAAAFSIGEFDIATIPTLPMRSPAEGMIAQAIAGLPGVSLGQYGSFAVDPVRLTGVTSIETDLTTDAFAGLRIFLDLARNVGVDGLPVKWQFVGPVTLGVALQRAGSAIPRPLPLQSTQYDTMSRKSAQRCRMRSPAVFSCCSWTSRGWSS